MTLEWMSKPKLKAKTIINVRGVEVDLWRWATEKADREGRKYGSVINEALRGLQERERGKR